MLVGVPGASLLRGRPNPRTFARRQATRGELKGPGDTTLVLLVQLMPGYTDHGVVVTVTEICVRSRRMLGTGRSCRCQLLLQNRCVVGGGDSMCCLRPTKLIQQGTTCRPVGNLTQLLQTYCSILGRTLDDYQPHSGGTRSWANPMTTGESQLNAAYRLHSVRGACVSYSATFEGFSNIIQAQWPFWVVHQGADSGNRKQAWPIGLYGARAAAGQSE
ncbi:hypothetical protein HaLaN_15484, partial [Haematococcus lacustris]